VNLREARENYYAYTGKTSDIARYLGFAGLGLIWIFATELTTEQRVPPSLVPATVWIVIGLGSDLLQYISGTIAWGVYGRWKEKSGVGMDEEFEAPASINWASLVFFVVKLVSMAIAYFFILKFLASRLL
jgi:hypothetical protein